MLLTLLKTLGPRLAKSWTPTEVLAYDQALQYRVTEREVDTIGDLHQVLVEIQSDPRTAIIRGTPNAATRVEMAAGRPVRRTLDGFDDLPSRLLTIDVDNFTGTVEEFVATLPAPFQDISYVWQFSGSHGHPSKPGLRAHLFFLLSAPITGAQLEAWLKAYVPQADSTVARPVQLNYTSAPVMLEGMVDPFAGRRLGLTTGILDDVVVLPVDMPIPDVAERSAGRGGRSMHVDPRGKPGVIGALCRAFSPSDVVDLFPDHFAAGSGPTRITWLHGGGSGDGIGVTSDGLGLFNTHNSSPIGSRSCNLFDAVRAHVFGALDGDGDYELMPSAAPSYVATEAWARALPEVDAELNPTTPEAKAETIEVIQAAKDTAAEVALEKEVSAEQRLINISSLIAKCETMTKLEHFVGRQVAKANLTPRERETIAQRVRQRTVALREPMPIGLIRQWLEPVTIDTQEQFPHLGPEGEVLGTLQNLEVLCARHGITIRYDVIRKRQEILGFTEEYGQDNLENATFASLTSLAAEVRMPHNSNQLKAYICALASRNQFNPVLSWIESEPWDGQERTDELLKTLTLKPDFDMELARKMLRKWMVQAVAAAASPVPLQTRGILVLQGEQYVGKSRWVASLVPGHEDLAVLGREIKPHDKDSVKIAISHWIAELGEIDSTFRKSDIASLKAFVANPSDSFRLPYAPAESKFQRRTVFMASVNDEHFLTDMTGNTRFWVLPVVAIDHTHQVNMQQLWAEILHAWRNGEAHWFDHEDMARVNASSEGFRQLSPTELRVQERFPWELARQGDPSVVWVERSSLQIAGLCGIPNPNVGDLGVIGRVTKRISGKPARGTKTGSRILIPLKRAEVDLEELEV